MNTSKNVPTMSSLLIGMAMILIVVTGLIHLVEAPDNLTEAAYNGVLFIVNGLAAFVAAYGIYRGAKSWGWGLGMSVAGGALMMYVVSRTVGLPGLGIDDAWFEPMGVLSLLVEGAYVVVAWVALTRKQDSFNEDLSRPQGRQALHVHQ